MKSVIGVSGAYLGTMVHKLMEMLVSSKNTIDVRLAAPVIISEFFENNDEARNRKLTDTLVAIAEKMRNGGYPQKNGVDSDILNTLLKADEVYCEVPFCFTDVNDSVMDVVYRVGDSWQIIDYKTNADGNNLDSKYAYQLDAYKNAFHKITGEEADAKIYHIDV